MIARVAFALLALASLASAQTTLPSLDAQVELLEKAGEPTKPADLKVWRDIPEKKNAARIVESVYTQLSAPDRLGWDRAIVSHNQLISDYRLPLSAEDRDAIREAMNGNDALLEELDRIVECDGFDWGEAPASPLATKKTGFPFIYAGSARSLLWFDGLSAVEAGDEHRAWRRVESLRRLAEGMSLNPGGNESAAWLHLHELAAQLAWYAAAMDLAKAAPADRKLLESLAAYWRDDKTIYVAWLHAMRRERVALIDMNQSIGSGKFQPDDIKFGGFKANDFREMNLGEGIWPAVLALETKLIDAAKSVDTLSFATSGKNIRAVLEATPRNDPAAVQVAAMIGPWLSGQHESVLQLRGRQKLAAVAIAIRLHRMDHNGTLPAKLDDLVPRYLDAVPLDPTLREPLAIRYRAGANSVIWTAGQNWRDDGGKERPRGVSRYRVSEAVDELVHLQLPATQPAH